MSKTGVMAPIAAIFGGSWSAAPFGPNWRTLRARPSCAGWRPTEAAPRAYPNEKCTFGSRPGRCGSSPSGAMPVPRRLCPFGVDGQCRGSTSTTSLQGFGRPGSWTGFADTAIVISVPLPLERGGRRHRRHKKSPAARVFLIEAPLYPTSLGRLASSKGHHP